MSVYNLFDEYAPAWRLMTWVELLLESGPRVTAREPLLQIIDLGDIGTVRRARIEVSLSTCLYEGNINGALKRLGLDEPEEGEKLVFENRKEVLGKVVIANDEAILIIDKVSAEDEYLGTRPILKIRSGDAELSVPLPVILETDAKEITATKEELVEKKIPKRVWRKDLAIGSVRTTIKVEVVGGALASPYEMRINAEAEATIEEVDEALIDHLKSEIKGIALSLILGKPSSAC